MNENEPDMIHGQWDRLRRAIVIVLVVILAALWLIWGPVEPICYVGGLFNSMYVWVLMLYLSLLIGPAIVLFPALVVYTPITWYRQTPRARRCLILWTLAAGGLVIPIFTGFAGLTASPFDKYVRGFAKYAERRAGVGAIQVWLGKQDPNMLSAKYGVVIQKDLTGPEQPAPIADLHPKRAAILLGDKGYLVVRLLWGSGFVGHWGIVVGPTDMPMSPPDSSTSREQRFPLVPGAYVWSRK